MRRLTSVSTSWVAPSRARSEVELRPRCRRNETCASGRLDLGAYGQPFLLGGGQRAGRVRPHLGDFASLGGVLPEGGAILQRRVDLLDRGRQFRHARLDRL